MYDAHELVCCLRSILDCTVAVRLEVKVWSICSKWQPLIRAGTTPQALQLRMVSYA
jgi:hypothetical protein